MLIWTEEVHGSLILTDFTRRLKVGCNGELHPGSSVPPWSRVFDIIVPNIVMKYPTFNGIQRFSNMFTKLYAGHPAVFMNLK